MTTAPDLTKTLEFNKANPTVFYFHGFQGNMTSDHILTIVNAYLTRADSNLVVVDWTQLSNTNYIMEIVPNVWKVSSYS